MSKVTLATLKRFVKKNRENLWINVKSYFDGMIDGTAYNHDGFKKAGKSDYPHSFEHDLGISGAWFVGRSGDYFKAYDKDGFKGYEVYNSCGCFILAVNTNSDPNKANPKLTINFDATQVIPSSKTDSFLCS